MNDSTMRKGLIYIVIFLVLLLAPSGVRYVQYYRLGADAPEPPPSYDPAEIPEVPIPPAGDFEDEPAEEAAGTVLLDRAHENEFTLDEISYLDGRLAARGFELRAYTGGGLATALRSVNAFVTISPLTDFTRTEIQAVTDFVNRGGRLLMVGDPTSFVVEVEETAFGFTFNINGDEIPLNSVANAFNITYRGDYLYNTTENEGNFRNIILKDSGFAENGLTEGMNQLAFYSVHSLLLGAGSVPLITADANTWSSATDRPGGLVVAATGAEGRVLALGDVHFLTGPYYTVFDNDRFIAAIADFLIETTQRDVVLADFPFLFQDEVNLVYLGEPDLGPDAFDEIIDLQQGFRRVDKALQLSAVSREDQDNLILGLYNQTEAISDVLDAHDIALVIDPPLEIEEAEAPTPTPEADEEETADTGSETEAPPQDEEENGDEEAATDETQRLIRSQLGTVQMAGMALILLDETEAQRSVIVLAASSEGLENTVNRLLEIVPLDAESALSDCLLQDNLALCPTGVADEPVEPELDTGGAPGEAEEEPEPEEADEETDGPEIDAVEQGNISLDETVEATVAEEESHAWVFNEGPTTIDILVESGPDLDAVLEIYDPDNQLIDSADNSFTGESESLTGIAIPDDGNYTIVVRDFFSDGGSYTLTVSEGEPGEDDEGTAGGSQILIFADDDGVPLEEGFTSVGALTTLLTDTYDVTVWTASVDGLLPADTLAEQDLLIWDSGDYRDEDGLLDEDTATILEYIEAGGSVFITGSSPTVFGDIELAPLADLEVSDSDPTLHNGLEDGQIIELDQTYEAALSDVESDPESTTILLRGPESDESGTIAAMATIDNGQKTILLFAPFVAMPEEIQATLIDNFIAWFGLEAAP